MSLKLSQADFNKLVKGENVTKSSQTKKPEYKRQLEQAITRLKAFQTGDSIYFNEDYSKCILHFKDISLLSNNVSLRLGARQMDQYKKLWHRRVEKLINSDMLAKWAKAKKNKSVIEFCYEVKGNFMDYDGRVAAFKAPLDGLVEAGLLYDDKPEHLEMILAKQAKTKTGSPNLIIMISAYNEQDFFSKDFTDFLINQK